MGQRLNLEIIKDGDLIGNIYYHWSGYTECAIAICKELLLKYKEAKKASPKQIDEVIFYNIIKEDGGGFGATYQEDEERYLKSLDGEVEIKHEDVNRNEGLIAFTEKGMDLNEYSGETSAFIEIDLGKFNIQDTLIVVYEDEQDEVTADKTLKYAIDESFTPEEADDLLEKVEKYDYFESEGTIFSPLK